MAFLPRDRFSQFVASKGHTVAEQMARVVDTVFDQSGTFGHEVVLEALEGKASRVMVYRTFTTMLESGVLRQVRFNEREDFVVVAGDH